MRAPSALLIMGLMAWSAGAGGAQEPDAERIPLSEFPRATVRIATHAGRVHRFDVYVAQSPAQHTQGLMFVESLPATSGMIFPFEPPRRAAMWMKNTLIALDMLFIRADGTIANIIAEAAPGSLESRRAIDAVAYVLELNGGTAARLGIEAGARVIVEAAAP